MNTEKCRERRVKVQVRAQAARNSEQPRIKKAVEVMALNPELPWVMRRKRLTMSRSSH